MIPEPLHPALVHFPIVLMFLVPIAALVAVLITRKSMGARRIWVTPMILTVLLAFSAWASTQTGEAQEERVEDVVGESALHTHEEAAEVFFIGALVLMGLAALGFARGPVGTAARVGTTVAGASLILLGVRVGASGGELVYRHGAAAAYTEGAAPAGREHEEDDDEGAAVQTSGATLVKSAAPTQE